MMFRDPFLRALERDCRDMAVDGLSIEIHDGSSFRAEYMDMNGRMLIALHADDPVFAVVYLSHDLHSREKFSLYQEEFRSQAEKHFSWLPQVLLTTRMMASFHALRYVMKPLIILLIALFSVSAQAQNFKCKTPEGKTIFQEIPCQGTTRTEAVRGNDYVPPSERYAAQQRRMNDKAQVDTIEQQAEQRRLAAEQHRLAEERQEIRQRQIDQEQRLQDIEQRQRKYEQDAKRAAPRARPAPSPRFCDVPRGGGTAFCY